MRRLLSSVRTARSWRFRLAAALLLIGACSPPENTGSSSPPNILLVIADDFGVDVSPCYSVGTSNLRPSMSRLSQLCSTGVVFDRAWATPECSPTRAALLTGRYGLRTNVGAAADALSTSWRSLHQLLAEHGYANATIGKWHLGGAQPDLAQTKALGVEFYQGVWAGAVADYENWTETLSDGSQIARTDYATTVLSNDAIAWLMAAQQPWFLWLAYTAPHSPFHLPPAALHNQTSLAGTSADIRAQPLQYYVAAAEALDHEFGRVLDSLSPEVLANTTIVFMGDNGSPSQVAQSPYSSSTAKSTLFEGGVRVPLVVAGSSVSRRGEHESAMVQVQDVFATLAELGGAAQRSDSDGRTFGSALAAGGHTGRDFLYSEFFRGGTPRVGDDPSGYGWTVTDSRYKLIHYDSTDRRVLFDLQSDPGEQNNLLESAVVTAELAAIADRLQLAGTTLRASTP